MFTLLLGRKRRVRRHILPENQILREISLRRDRLYQTDRCSYPACVDDPEDCDKDRYCDRERNHHRILILDFGLALEEGNRSRSETVDKGEDREEIYV